MTIIERLVKADLNKKAAAKTVYDLPDDARLSLSASSDFVGVSFDTPEGKGARLKAEGYPCKDRNYIQVKKTYAPHGWGPLLYDIAIELATKVSYGMISDRGSISDDAQAVWKYYKTKRTSDVIATPMNIMTCPMNNFMDMFYYWGASEQLMNPLHTTYHDFSDWISWGHSSEQAARLDIRKMTQNHPDLWKAIVMFVKTSPFTNSFRWKGPSNLALIKQRALVSEDFISKYSKIKF